MSTQDFARRVRGVGALTDPVRRALYQFVVGQAEPVSREQAAAAAGVAHHVARFQLDRLVTEGLLEVEFRRLSGRTGPGAGRPAKLYRRAGAEVAVSLPERRYDLAGELLATAIESAATAGGSPLEALREAASAHGSALGRQVRPGGVVANGPGLMATTVDALAAQGYEPRVAGAEITLANCPFHALVAGHPALVCNMNLALLAAAGEALADGAVRARLDPAPGRCCVVLTVQGADDGGAVGDGS